MIQALPCRTDTWPRGYKLFPYSTKLSKNFILLIKTSVSGQFTMIVLAPYLDAIAARKIMHVSSSSRYRGNRTFSMLNPAEHEIYPAHKC